MSDDVALKKLTPAQCRVVAGLLSGLNYTTIAQQAGVSEPTIDRWVKLEQVQNALAAAKRHTIELAGNRLVFASRLAIDTLIEVMQDSETPPGVKVRAAEAVIGNMLRVVEVSDLQRRLDELEAEDNEIA